MHRTSFMVLLAVAPVVGAQSGSSAPAKAPAPLSAEQAHRADDIAKHRQMARAHEEAAHCLEGGTPEKQCRERLRDACKGIAVGQYCGLRHTH